MADAQDSFSVFWADGEKPPTPCAAAQSYSNKLIHMFSCFSHLHGFDTPFYHFQLLPVSLITSMFPLLLHSHCSHFLQANKPKSKGEKQTNKHNPSCLIYITNLTVSAFFFFWGGDTFCPLKQLNSCGFDLDNIFSFYLKSHSS